MNSTMSLQQALDAASSASSVECVSIDVPSGTHTLTSQTLVPGEVGDVMITGAGGEVGVICDYGADVVSNYTWYFAGLRSVSLYGMRFESCPRPIRLDTIAAVEIQNCTFR